MLFEFVDITAGTAELRFVGAWASEVSDMFIVARDADAVEIAGIAVAFWCKQSLFPWAGLGNLAAKFTVIIDAGHQGMGREGR